MNYKTHIFVNGVRVKSLPDKKCLTCKKTFSPNESARKYCSRECYYKMKIIRGDRVNWTDEMKEKMSKRYMGEGNPMYGKEVWDKGKKRPEITGEKHFNWKGGFSINKSGYKVFETEKYTDGVKIFEHKRILEEKLGRKLNKDEVTHHINGNKLDNRPENLMVMTRSQHMKHHMKDIRKGFIK